MENNNHFGSDCLHIVPLKGGEMPPGTCQHAPYLDCLTLNSAKREENKRKQDKWKSKSAEFEAELVTSNLVVRREKGGEKEEVGESGRRTF